MRQLRLVVVAAATNRNAAFVALTSPYYHTMVKEGRSRYVSVDDSLTATLYTKKGCTFCDKVVDILLLLLSMRSSFSGHTNFSFRAFVERATTW